MTSRSNRSDLPGPPKRARRGKIIPATAYPALARHFHARELVRVLRSEDAIARAVRVVKLKQAELRGAVLDHVARMQQAAQAGDNAAIYQQAHEIRGFAATAGMRATGRIADGLCKYLDKAARSDAAADPALVTLHLSAIARGAHAEDEESRWGDQIAEELAALVARTLADLNVSATSPPSA